MSFFFFSSRRRHTRCGRDWSSDVCSSDLEYALERLQEAAEEDTRAERHAEWFLELAEEAAPRLVGPEQTMWLERLAREHDNLQAALSWLAASADGARRCCVWPAPCG